MLEKHILEVKEVTESNLKIKPRKYKLSPYWMTLFESYDGLKSYEQISNDFKNKTIEALTAQFIERIL